MKKNFINILIAQILILLCTGNHLLAQDVDSLIHVIASKCYKPKFSKDFHLTLDHYIGFYIPEKLTVVHGDAGSHTATLEIKTSSNKKIILTYKGRKSKPYSGHYRHSGDKDYFFFKSSDNSIGAGSLVFTNFFNVHINDGDSRFGTTVIATPIPLAGAYGVYHCGASGPTYFWFHSDTPIISVVWTWAGGSATSTQFPGIPGWPYVFRATNAGVPPGPFTVTVNTGSSTQTYIFPINPVATLPTVNAGPDQVRTTCTLPQVFNISGTVSGTPGTGIWSTSGSGTFGNPNSLITTYTFSTADLAAGSVTLTLTSTGTQCTASDQLVLTVPATPTVSAGTDITRCNNPTFNLSGTRGGEFYRLSLEWRHRHLRKPCFAYYHIHHECF
jgi:hypothetical protein